MSDLALKKRYLGGAFYKQTNFEWTCLRNPTIDSQLYFTSFPQLIVYSLRNHGSISESFTAEKICNLPHFVFGF